MTMAGAPGATQDFRLLRAKPKISQREGYPRNCQFHV